ncbi:alpha/beta fold hydrolase [Streptomyces sp. NPDC005407]|uniref:thioesterase II family protein n=1 Tax=Streptomyces sp. NPDC005407 TaxID=3155340 RepID=UPI00339DCB89
MHSEWLRRFGPASDNGIRLFCFPHAGGSASAFLPLTRALSALSGEVDVLAAQYPGRQDRRREPPVESITGLADALADEIRPLSGRPYAFFGHSMGAVVAYETARRLTQRGAPRPLRLFLSGRGAPAERPYTHDRLMHDAAVLAAIRRLGGTASRVLDDPEVLAMVMPALRADYGALGSYDWRPGAPLTAPVTVLIGDSDPVVTVDEAAAWCNHTSGGCELRVFPGGHFYLDGLADELAAVVLAGLPARTAGSPA